MKEKHFGFKTLCFCIVGVIGMWLVSGCGSSGSGLTGLKDGEHGPGPEIRLQASNKELLLRWTSPTDTSCDSVTIYRSENESVEGVEVYSGMSPFFRDRELSNGTTYYYTLLFQCSDGDQSLVSDVSGTPEDVIVNIPDDGLRKKILSIISGDTIYSSSLQRIQGATFKSLNIQNLEGMEYFSNMEFLFFPSNQIADIECNAPS